MSSWLARLELTNGLTRLPDPIPLWEVAYSPALLDPQPLQDKKFQMVVLYASHPVDLLILV